jgi:DNA-binding transcriptional MerR regulator
LNPAIRSRTILSLVRIGELAERSGVEATTIRYYERIGLMPPPSRKESGYRDYGEEATARLGFIRAAQSVGLTLGEIRETLAFRDRGETPCRHVAALIERNAAQLRQRISALEAMRRELERLAKKARAISADDAPEAAFCHIIEG